MLDVESLRRQFPALQHTRAGKQPIFLDGPGGTQVPRRVIEAITNYLTTCNANHGGVFAGSQESDRILESAHQAAADLVRACAPEEIVFGANMTTLTFHLSRAIGQTLKAGDEVLVTRLDHDANVSPWVLMARDAGATVRFVDIRPEDCTLDLEDLRRQLGSRTKLVAVGCASNAVGSINDVRNITRWAHDAGALVFLDAVHYAPHEQIDVQDWGCDFLAFSAYKFFGPHVGILWGKRDLLEELPAYKLRPAPDSLPGRWMTGTQNHEGLAGLGAAIAYLAEIGAAQAKQRPEQSNRRSLLRAAMSAIHEYEATLGKHLLEGLAARPRFKVWGITDPSRFSQRVPTVAITMADRSAVQIARHLASRHIFVWSGDFYAKNLVERLDLEAKGGLLRIGLCHYNTSAEIDLLLAALDEL